ncbi:MAG: DNA-binding protein [Nitrososphaerales archaeon]
MPSDSVEDADMKILNARRMHELRKKMNLTLMEKKRAEEQKNQPPKKAPPTDREVVLRSLSERGDEVLRAAEAGYPRETAMIIPKLASLVREGKVSVISGGELLQLFRSLGMRVSVPTSISVQEHGKFVSLSEKLKKSNPD